MPNLSVANSPGILSSHTARTLKTEIREQPESKGGFWDKFKSLSLGQKIGRSSATIGSGLVAGGGGVGIGMAAGLGLGLATGGIALVAFGIGALVFYGATRLARSSKEQARVVRQEECRPRETKIQKSEATLPTRKNIPLKCTTVLGADGSETDEVAARVAFTVETTVVPLFRAAAFFVNLGLTAIGRPIFYYQKTDS